MKNSRLKEVEICIYTTTKNMLLEKMAMISQDFSQSLNPVIKIKNQMIEAPIYHKILNKEEALKKSKDIKKLI